MSWTDAQWRSIRKCTDWRNRALSRWSIALFIAILLAAWHRRMRTTNLGMCVVCAFKEICRFNKKEIGQCLFFLKLGCILICSDKWLAYVFLRYNSGFDFWLGQAGCPSFVNHFLFSIGGPGTVPGLKLGLPTWFINQSSCSRPEGRKFCLYGAERVTDHKLICNMVGSCIVDSWTRRVLQFLIPNSFHLSFPGDRHFEAAKQELRCLRKIIHLSLV